MLNWIDHAHAGYVVAAYAVAFIALTGLAWASWRAHANRCREWRAIQKNNPAASE